MARDRTMTKKKILQAFGDLLAEKGFEGVGVNAVARRAGVDKVLIYRYFGGLDQLMKTYAQSGDFWPGWSETTGLKESELADRDLREITKAALTGHLSQLRKRPLTQEIMRWELMTRNELTDEMARTREETTHKFLELTGKLAEEPETADLLAAGAIIHAGISYLVLRAATADVYMDVDLTSEAGWERIGRAVESLVDGYFYRVEARITGPKEK